MSTGTLPNDLRLMALLLGARGIEDADERVLLQLIDLAHRHSSELLTDALSYSEHAGRSKLEVKDVEMAVRARSAYEFEEGAPKDYLLPLAKQLNSTPLPIFTESFTTIRLPPLNKQIPNSVFEGSGASGSGGGLGGSSFKIVPVTSAAGQTAGDDWDMDSNDEEEDEDEAGQPTEEIAKTTGDDNEEEEEEDGEDDEDEDMEPIETAPSSGVVGRIEVDDFDAE